MNGVLIFLGMVAAIKGICAMKPARPPYVPEARSTMRVVPHPFDWAKDPEVTK